MITSGDDDDDDNDDSSSTAGSGGSDTGSGGSSTGGSETGNGGAAGETGEGGANACEVAIEANCAADWAACESDCKTELFNAQGCLTDIINEQGGQPTYEEQYACADAAGVDGGLITTQFSDLFACIWCSEAAADECLGGFDDPPDCAAGGAGS